MIDLVEDVRKAWLGNQRKMDWLGLENLLVRILRLGPGTISTEERLALLKEAIDAKTRRGHFDPGHEYLPADWTFSKVSK